MLVGPDNIANPRLCATRRSYAVLVQNGWIAAPNVVVCDWHILPINNLYILPPHAPRLVIIPGVLLSRIPAASLTASCRACRAWPPVYSLPTRDIRSEVLPKRPPFPALSPGDLSPTLTRALQSDTETSTRTSSSLVLGESSKGLAGARREPARPFELSIGAMETF